MALRDFLLNGFVGLVVWGVFVFLVLKLYYQWQLKKARKNYSEDKDPGKKGTITRQSPNKEPQTKTTKPLPTLSKKERENIIKEING